MQFIFLSSVKNLDVSSIITKRLNAMRKLQDNPLDSEALKLMYNTQKDVSSASKFSFGLILNKSRSIEDGFK